MNMAGLNGAGPVGGMPMMNHGPNGLTNGAGFDSEETDYEHKLNSLVYGYFLKIRQFDLARALLNSGLGFSPPVRRNGEMNGQDDAMHTDSKDDVDVKRPNDLPPPPDGLDQHGTSFLLEWFSLFWDVYFAQRKDNKASLHAKQYYQATNQQSRRNQEQQQMMMRGMPGGMMPTEQYQRMIQMQNAMPMNGDLRQRAFSNNRGMQMTPQQMAQQSYKQQQILLHQQQMRRDPSDADMNGQRPRTPSSADNAPSPSKRPRLEGAQFNGQGLMPNGRPAPPNLHMQQIMGEKGLQANQMLTAAAIPPNSLSGEQLQAFQQLTPSAQQKSIQVYAQQMQNQTRAGMNRQGIPNQGSPMMNAAAMDLTNGMPDFAGTYPSAAAAMQMQRGGQVGPGGQSNHALQDYQMQLMLLEQQNKKRLLMARQEQDGQPNNNQLAMPNGPGFPPGMSPSGSRSGHSPNPSEMAKRGSPKMNQASLTGSPMPDGSMPRAGASPGSMYNGMQPDMYPQMKMENMSQNGSMMRPPPSSYPQPSLTQQQMAEMRGRSNGNWQQGQPGPAPGMQQPQGQPPGQMGTPQQRSMPPPQAVPTGGPNGRPPSPQVPAPPTPQTTTKANPKGKKDTESKKKKPAKKNSTAGSVAATPAAETENPPPTPTPSTPITPMNPNSFNKPDGQNQAPAMQGPTSAAPVQSLAPPQPDNNAGSQFTAMDGVNNEWQFGTDINGDVLENFDFDAFLQDGSTGSFDFDPTTLSFADPDGVEAGAGEA